MSDSSTPIEIPHAPEQGVDDSGVNSLLTTAVVNELDLLFSPVERSDDIVSKERNAFDEIIEGAELAELERDNPELYIAQLGAMATVRQVANSAKFATNVESRTYKQVADGVISRDDNDSQEVSSPKQEFDPLNPKTKFGKFVSRALFGETAPSSKKFNPEKVLARQNRTTRMAGGTLSARALQKYRDDN